MAATFHVYVEGPVDRAPDAIRRLAAAIAQRYGLPEEDLARRIAAGRFRVKSSVDRTTAETYQRALADCGARVSIEDADAGAQPRQSSAVTPPARSERSARYSVSPPITTGRTVLPEPGRAKTPSVPGVHRSQAASTPPETARRASPSPSGMHRSQAASTPPETARRASPSLPPASAPRSPASSSLPPATASRPSSSSLPPATASRPSSSSLPPATASRPSSSSLPPATQRPSTSKPPQFQSGLAAAFTQDSAASADLGALGSGALSLASLDGGDTEPAPSAVTFAPPAAPLPASIGPAAAAPATPAPARPPQGPPVDLFAPPDAEAADAIVEIAADELEHRARKESVQPATTTPASASASAPAPTTPVLAPSRKRRATGAHEQGGVVAPDLPRGRFAAGVLLAILVGFVPAHLVASSREASAFASIDAQVNATQLAADTPETYAALDAFRAAQLDRKKSEQRSIALTSMLIWAVVGAGAAYVWFRRIPWNKGETGDV